MTMGTLRAIVFLPLSAVTSLGADELEVVLAHELAHVRRADFFWNILQTVVETLFFFHPAVWWLNARIRHERELCCDDLALRICPNPLVYAHALFRLEEQRSRYLRLAMALDGHQSHQTLLARIATRLLIPRLFKPLPQSSRRLRSMSPPRSSSASPRRLPNPLRKHPLYRNPRRNRSQHLRPKTNLLTHRGLTLITSIA
jgi:Zn-dependent protease with chaperone function